MVGALIFYMSTSIWLLLRIYCQWIHALLQICTGVHFILKQNPRVCTSWYFSPGHSWSCGQDNRSHLPQEPTHLCKVDDLQKWPPTIIPMPFLPPRGGAHFPFSWSWGDLMTPFGHKMQPNWCCMTSEWGHHGSSSSRQIPAPGPPTASTTRSRDEPSMWSPGQLVSN